MSYFADNYPHLGLPIAADARPGFRKPQLAALHSCAANFYSKDGPAIVTMPTGSGKTLILMALAFMVQAKRVLIITPSRLVREQIVDEFGNLSLLKDINALASTLAPPKVLNAKNRVTTMQGWHEMTKYDVVVGAVPSISPAIAAIPTPPSDLFDVVLVDEAHHSPARTWQALLDCFPTAKRTLFTATPFRQDQKEIKGKFVYTYSLKEAYEDRVFGDIQFIPVDGGHGRDGDIAIAQATEQQFRKDREAGLNHLIMVRTDTRKRADELVEVYEQHTGLKLKMVTGNHSLKIVKQAIQQLETNELDGIVCVNMLGEGFNMPRLKIAAIHSPHKSLSVTLQFIGRFARTTAPDIGKASFLAIPSEIKIESALLYEDGAIWQRIIENLSATRVDEEVETREVLETFITNSQVSEELQDLSLYSLWPYHHIKVYEVNESPDLSHPIKFPGMMKIVYHSISEETGAVVYITREVRQVSWSSDPRFTNVDQDLFIFHYNAKARLLFICASRRVDGLYQEIADRLCPTGFPQILPLKKLNKALNGLKSAEFFNVGMRNRVNSNSTESYRIVVGPSADRAVQASDARIYHRGHCFGKGIENGEEVTIGISSSSKIWSNSSTRIPTLIRWCDSLAEKMDSDEEPKTNSGLDHLSTGDVVARIPRNIMWANWADKSLYTKPMFAEYANEAGDVITKQLLDFDLIVEPDRSDDNTIGLLVRGDDIECRFLFTLEGQRPFEYASEDEHKIYVQRGAGRIPLLSYLNEELLYFYTTELGCLHGRTFVDGTDSPSPFDVSTIDAFAWDDHAVDITKEFGECIDGRLSIHSLLEQLMPHWNNQIIFYDHGSGEMADFVVISSDDNATKISLYHCKGSGGARPGQRLDDLYEVCGQAVKCVVRADIKKIMSAIKSRIKSRKGKSRFIKGDITQLEAILESAYRIKVSYEVVIVQPGVTKANVSKEHALLLSAASDHLVRGGFEPLKLMASA